MQFTILFNNMTKESQYCSGSSWLSELIIKNSYINNYLKNIFS